MGCYQVRSSPAKVISQATSAAGRKDDHGDYDDDNLPASIALGMGFDCAGKTIANFHLIEWFSLQTFGMLRPNDNTAN
jgi:hypothetical protein